MPGVLTFDHYFANQETLRKVFGMPTANEKPEVQTLYVRRTRMCALLVTLPRRRQMLVSTRRAPFLELFFKPAENNPLVACDFPSHNLRGRPHQA